MTERNRKRTRRGEPVNKSANFIGNIALEAVAKNTSSAVPTNAYSTGPGYMPDGGVPRRDYADDGALSAAVPTGSYDRFPNYSQQRTEGAPGLAVGNRDLKNHSTDVSGILSILRSNPYNFLGQGGFNGTFAGTDAPAGAPGNRVVTHDADFAGQAGSYDFQSPMLQSGAPRGDNGYSTARGSATSPNPSYPMGAHPGGAAAPNPMGCKEMSKLDIMKATQQRMA